MKRSISFEYKISITTFILLVLITIVGIYTYSSYTSIVRNLSSSSEKDVEIADVKSLITNVFEAEIEVKSFSITKDSMYLRNYELFKTEVKGKLLDLYDTNESGQKSKILDSVLVMIEAKMLLMDELLLIQAEQRVANALDSAYEKIKKEVKEDQKEEEKEEEPKNSAEELEKKAKWKLFAKLKKDKPSESDSSDAEKTVTKEEASQVSLQDVNKNLNDVKYHESEVNEAIIEKELELILAGNDLTESINGYVAELEQMESDRILAHTKAAKTDIRNLNFQILFFCVALVAFLLLMTFIILNYARNNNRFKGALKKAKREAEKLAKTKERFLATVSHEIRTPMNSIAGFTDLIAKGPLTSEQRDHISMVQKSTTHLLHLINDVLDITKLQNGKVKLEEVNFDVRQILNDVASFARPMAEEKNNDLICEIKPNVPKTLKGDIHRLQQIIINILSNAIKFTENGTIKLEAFPILMNGSETHLKLVITDSGIGMNSEQLKRIFQEFEQAAVSTTRNYGGTGLGLAITKRLINLFKGTIKVESEVGHGTKVIIDLPFKIGEESQVVNIDDVKRVDASFLRNKRILIADDELFNRKLLLSMLKDKQVYLTEVENGKKAVQEIKSNQYDLILMDVRMPEMNGIEATKKIRKINDHTKKDIPIIALTAAVTEEDKENYFHSGMSGFVPKPFKEDQLMSALLDVFGNQQKKTNKISNPMEMDIKDIKEMTTALSFDELKKLSGSDDSFYKDMLGTFIGGAEEGMEKMKKDLEEDQPSRLADHAHKISAPAKHLGADKLYAILKNIEIKGRKGDYLDFKQLIPLCETELSSVIKLVKEEMNK